MAWWAVFRSAPGIRTHEPWAAEAECANLTTTPPGQSHYKLSLTKESAFLISILILIANDVISVAGSMYLLFHEMPRWVGLIVKSSKSKLSYQNALLIETEISCYNASYTMSHEPFNVGIVLEGSRKQNTQYLGLYLFISQDDWKTRDVCRWWELSAFIVFSTKETTCDFMTPGVEAKDTPLFTATVVVK